MLKTLVHIEGGKVYTQNILVGEIYQGDLYRYSKASTSLSDAIKVYCGCSEVDCENYAQGHHWIR